jgi:hypothetical protein
MLNRLRFFPLFFAYRGSSRMIRLTAAAVAAVTLAASPALAQFPGQPAGVQINKPGDAALTCEQILAEANPLNTIVTAQKQAADAQAAESQAAAAKSASSRRIAGGLMGGVLGGAAQFGMMRGALNNPLTRQAVLAASQGANTMANTPEPAPTAAAPAAPPSAEQQRMTVLLGLYQAKACG